jgi:hypothetical protein
MVKRYYAH